MRYYKIIQDGTIVGAGTMFLRWYDKYGSFFYCDMENAECVQDVVTERLYHPDWLNGVPGNVYPQPRADVVIVDATEYDDIVEQLMGGETIPVPEPEPEPEPEPDPGEDPEPEERPMTVQEMREKIKEQEEMIAAQDEQLQMLTECILEMSEVVYGE